MGEFFDGGELVARTLRTFGVNVAFGLHGGHLNSVLMGFKNNGIRVIDTRHEAAAVNAADGYARASGRLGVAYATASAGFVNAVPGIAVAHADRSPVLIITSSPPLRDDETNTFQGMIDQVGIATPITNYAHRVATVEEIPRILGFAIRRAFADGNGPVLVDIPIDILFTPIDLDTVDWGGGNKLAAAPAPARQAVADALRLLSEAERPAIIAGEGALHHGELVREFIERSGIPLFTQWGMHDLVPFDHPLYGYHVRGLAFGKFKEIGIPDVVLVLGARIGMSEDFRNQNVVPATAALIHVYEDPAEIGRLIPAEVGITASVPETLAAFLADDVAWPDRSGWASAIVGAHRFRRPAADGPTEVDGRLHPFHVAKTVLEALPPGTHIVGDGSDCLHWLDDAIYYGNPGSSTGYGGYFCQLGTGFGFAVGRQLAFPDQRIVLVTGDGAFGIHPAEIDTMVRFELPIVVVLFNNAAWGSSTQGQLLYYGENGVVGSRLADSAYDKVAEGFGAYGERVDSLEDLAPALQRAFDSGLPAVINVAVADVEDSLAAPLLNWTDDPDTLVIPYYDNVRRREWYRPGRYRATSGQSVGHDATIAI